MTELGKIVVVIQEAPDGDGLRMHVRHEAPDGLWDSQEWAMSGMSPDDDLTRVLERVPRSVRKVLQLTDERWSHLGRGVPMDGSAP